MSRSPLRTLLASPNWLWLVVLLQLAIPASYYLSRSDPEDERFAWRMFSATRLRSCGLSAFQTSAGVERPIDLDRALHASWLGALRRGRRVVIDKFLWRQCVHQPVQSVRLVRQCHEADGRLLPDRQYRLDCRAPGVLTDEAP